MKWGFISFKINNDNNNNNKTPNNKLCKMRQLEQFDTWKYKMIAFKKLK